MKILQWFGNILKALFTSIKRFPFTILLSVLIAFSLIVISETKPSQDILAKCVMVFALGVPISLSIKLFYEEKKKKIILSY